MKNVNNSVLYLYEVLSQLYWWKHLNIPWLYLNNLSSKFFQLQMYQTNLNICDKLKVGWVVVVISAVALHVLSMWLRPLPKQVREYSRYCYFRPAGVLPEVLYQTSGSTPQEYSQCKILRGLGVLPEVLYQTCGSTPTKMVREGSGSTPRLLKIIHWECSWLDI